MHNLYFKTFNSKMAEPEKPFACTFTDCGMTFTNEDHLHVHTKKHDMVLQLGLEQKTAFADQTPTPTRFIRNCEEVGLFQDLQNVNPFDEGFKRAMEAKCSALSLEGLPSDDVLHTPQTVFPLIDSGDSTLYSTTNNHRNITISRSSSDESGIVKEYETTTISKLTNEVTTISRIIGKQDILDKITTDDVSIVKHQEIGQNKDLINETSVSYTNNVIIHSNVEIIKDSNLISVEPCKVLPVTLISHKDSVIKDASSVLTKDVLLTDGNKLQVPEIKMPIMSQKSIDFVVDSFTAECQNIETLHHKEQKENSVKVLTGNPLNVNPRNKTVIKSARNTLKRENRTNTNIKRDVKEVGNNDYEVIIKLPNGKHVRMKAVEEPENSDKNTVIQHETKQKLKDMLKDKVDKKSHIENPSIQRIHGIENAQIVPNIVPIAGGTLYPVTIVNPVSNPILLTNTLQKIPIAPLNLPKLRRQDNRKSVKRKPEIPENSNNNTKSPKIIIDTTNDRNLSELRNQNQISKKTVNNNKVENSDSLAQLRNAASKRYRIRIKEKIQRQAEEITQLKRLNERLTAENGTLKTSLHRHIKLCSNATDLRAVQDGLLQTKKTVVLL